MKRIFYKIMLTMIVFAGLMIGMVKGQEAKQKWISKKKSKYENRQSRISPEIQDSLVILDEFEMATYHG
jgi:hypothetical protein